MKIEKIYYSNKIKTISYFIFVRLNAINSKNQTIKKLLLKSSFIKVVSNKIILHQETLFLYQIDPQKKTLFLF